MKIYASCLKVFVGLLLTLLPALAFAVTEKEMEEARTIAAKSYLRYANDGSGYLDDISPKTMAELEAALKTKEKENIKAFKAIPVPADYKGWDKEKLVEYWAVTAFQDKGLLEKGRGGRIRARSQINKMTISKPEATPAVSAPASAEAAAVGQPLSNPQDSLAPADAASELAAAENALMANQEAQMEEEPNVEKAYNYTWVYIMILAILVVVVIALVVYAANVFKSNKENASNGYAPKGADDSEDIQHYESLLSDKDVEIAMLKKRLEAVSRQNSELTSKLASLESELKKTKAEAYQPVQEFSPREAMEAGATIGSAPQKSPLRSIYLGRANSRGIFVRADRTLNVGHSIFLLTTSDGYSGSFKVAESPAAWSLALSNPGEYLLTACTGHNLDDTADVSKIITESSGTAVFEGGCWKVIRKAKIRYE